MTLFIILFSLKLSTDSFYPLFSINFRIFTKFSAVAIKLHSDFTFSNPRNPNLLNFNTDFIIPITGSIVYFLFYVPDSDNFQMFLETLNTNIVAGLLTAATVGIFLHKLEYSRRTGERRLQQRLELRKRALWWFEEINKL